MDGIETTTWHDQVPSHPPVSPDIATMEAKLADAIAYADNKLELWMHDSTGAILWEEVERATDAVVLVQNALYYLRELAHKNECSCTPDMAGICRFCYLEKRYKEFMEQCSEKEKEN